MKRWTMHLISGCCAVLTLVVLVHWVYSWFYMDRIQVRIGRSHVVIGTAQGRASFFISQYVAEKTHERTFALEYDVHNNLRERPVPQVWYADHSFLGIGIGSAATRNSRTNSIQMDEQTVQRGDAGAERAKARGDANGIRISSKLAAQARQSIVDMPRFVQLIVLPSWLLVLLFAALPAWWFPRVLRDRRRKRLGLCPKCGYDLRATPDRCPECGAIPNGM